MLLYNFDVLTCRVRGWGIRYRAVLWADSIHRKITDTAFYIKL